MVGYVSFFYETAYGDYHGLVCCLNLKCCTMMLIVWIILQGICGYAYDKIYNEIMK